MDTTSLNGHKRAVIYCRVSTDEQADKGYSLPTQLEACERYTHDNGFEVVGTFRDDYTGAVPLETRPEGRQAYDLLRSGAADVLIAYRIDRIVRPPEDGDEWDMPILIRGLAKLSKEIHVCNRGQLKTDFASLLIAMLDARKAGEERRDIAERTTRGRNAKAARGLVVGSGRSLYSYQYTDGKYIVNDTEARIVRLIFTWYTQGVDRHGPLSFKSIAAELSKLGIQTPGEAKGYTNRKRGAGIWDQSQVGLILDNEAYCGQLKYGSKQIGIDIPPIIPRELWQAAQTQRAANVKLSKRNTKGEYLLRGLITCGCGNSMTANVRKGRPAYRCNSHIYKHAGLEPTCNEVTARGELVETLAWCYAVGIVTERDKLPGRLHEAQAEARQAIQPVYDKLAAIDDDLSECETEAGQIAAAMAAIPKSQQETSIVFKSLQRKADELDERYKVQSRKRDALQAEITATEIKDESIYNLAIFAEDTEIGIEQATFEDKRRWLEYLRIRVEVKDGKATASTRLKVEPLTIELNDSRINRSSCLKWSASPSFTFRLHSCRACCITSTS